MARFFLQSAQCAPRRWGVLLGLFVLLACGTFAHWTLAKTPLPPAQHRVQLEPASIAAMQSEAASLLAQVRVAPRAADLARAQNLIERLLAIDAPRADALNAWRLLIDHRFDEALTAARRARSTGTDALLAAVSEADALTELGRYDEAESTVQYLLDHHYGIAALARASHLRMVFGDLPGAIELTERALALRIAAVDRAWLLLDLAELQLMAGAPSKALILAMAAVEHLPAPALAMQARAQAAQGKAEAALALYRVALDTDLRAETLLEVLRLARKQGELTLARRSAAVLDGMARLDANGVGSDRRCFVEFYAERGELITAEALARAEWRQRPDIFGAAQLAWVLLRADKAREAHAYAVYAVRLGTPDPLLQWRAGAVLAANGEARGKTLMATAVARDAHLADGAATLALRP